MLQPVFLKFLKPGLLLNCSYRNMRSQLQLLLPWARTKRSLRLLPVPAERKCLLSLDNSRIQVSCFYLIEIRKDHRSRRLLTCSRIPVHPSGWNTYIPRCDLVALLVPLFSILKSSKLGCVVNWRINNLGENVWISAFLQKQFQHIETRNWFGLIIKLCLFLSMYRISL